MLTYLYIFILALLCVPFGICVWLWTQSPVLALCVYLIMGVIYMGLVYRDGV